MIKNNFSDWNRSLLYVGQQGEDKSICRKIERHFLEQWIRDPRCLNQCLPGKTNPISVKWSDQRREEHKVKASQRLKGRNKGKRLEEIHGSEKAAEIRKKARGKQPHNKGKPFPEHLRQNLIKKNSRPFSANGVIYSSQNAAAKAYGIKTCSMSERRQRNPDKYFWVDQGVQND